MSFILSPSQGFLCSASSPLASASRQRLSPFSAAVLVIGTLCAFVPVRAGSYSVSYSGGTSRTQSDSMGTVSTYPYGPATYTANGTTYDGWGGAGTLYSSPTATSCSGTITATFTWQPASGQTAQSDPPPSQVFITENGLAQANSSQNYSPPPAGGAISNGLGQTMNPISQTPPSNGYSTASGSCQSTKYSTKSGGQTVTITCSPSASASGNVYNHCEVRYSASIAFVSVGLTGTTLVNGANQALTGQQITASLSIPAPFTLQAVRTWSAPGDTFKTYNPTLASNQFVALAGTDFSQPTLSFYDKKKESVAVSCSAKVLMPNGTIVTVTAKAPKIQFQKPTLTRWDIATGFVQLYQEDQNGQQYWGLGPDPAVVPSEDYGEQWKNVTITVPSPFAGGQGCFAQLITPDRNQYTFADPNTAVAIGNDNGVQGLDGIFPYDHNAPWTVPAAGKDGDSPAILALRVASNTSIAKTTANDSFKTWVMYMPPAVGSQGTVWIPLKSYTWNWSATVSWMNNQWTLTSGTPANAAANPNYTSSDETKHPTWNLVH